MQKITLIGNVGKDPIKKVTDKGVKVVFFSVAVSLGKEKTVWWTINVWERVLSSLGRIMEYVKKGTRVCIIGSMREPFSYVDKEGNPKTNLSVDLLSIDLLSSGKKPEETKKPSIGDDTVFEKDFFD